MTKEERAKHQVNVIGFNYEIEKLKDDNKKDAEAIEHLGSLKLRLSEQIKLKAGDMENRLLRIFELEDTLKDYE